MDDSNISELEQLLHSPRLIASNEYYNPNNEKEIFYSFVEDYATNLGIKIITEKRSFYDNQNDAWQQFKIWVKDSNAPPFDRITTAAENLFEFLFPHFYPIIGGGDAITCGRRYFIINEPTYKGISPIFSCGRTHEYMHAYHAVMARDLKKRGLIKINGYRDIDLSEPPVFIKCPSYKKLKKFEKRMLRKIIRKEKAKCLKNS